MPRARIPARIAVEIGPSDASGRVLDGILSVARSAAWTLTDQREEADAVLSTDARPADFSVPWVRFSTAVTGDADVRPDAAAVGRIAAVHFLDRGFRTFARAGCDAELAAAFDVAITAAGHLPSRVLRGTGLPLVSDAERTRVENPCHSDFLAPVFDLQRPFAVLAGDDRLARTMIDAARRVGLRVPDDVAVLGVGADRLTCEISAVPVSSIDLSPYALGRAAATRLRAIFRGKPPAGPTRVPPGGVVLRASTDTLATDDVDVIAAVAFIRDRAAGPLRTGDIVRVVGLDRRTLERRFAKSLGRSPMDVLRQIRVDRAAELLRTTSLPLGEIAPMCGFRLSQHLAVAFKRWFGQTPSDYRAVLGKD